MDEHHSWQGYGGSSTGHTVSPSQTLAMIDDAVAKAHSDLLAAGENISTWSVSRSALVLLRADSFESLGFPMEKIRSLNRLKTIEAKVNSFIHCFVGVQHITSLHELEMAICESKGIKSFEELELGPILKHPLVVHYFSIGSDVTEICKITSEQIVAYLSILLWRRRNIKIDDLLGYIAKRTGKTQSNLCIRIHSLRAHIGSLMRYRQSELTLLKKCSNGLDEKSILDNNEDDVHDSSLFPSLTATSSATSAAVPHIGLDIEMDCSSTSSYDRTRCNDFAAPFRGKEGSEIKFCTQPTIHKIPKIWMTGIPFKPEFQSADVETGFIDGNAVDGHTWEFIKIWKCTCKREENVVDSYAKMLAFYHGQMKPKKQSKALKEMITSYPKVALLNVAIASIKFGLWDRMSSCPHANSNEVVANTNSKACASHVSTNVELPEKEVSEGSVGIALEDILKYVKAYFVFSDYVLDNTTSYPKKQMIFLRELRKLECSLTQQFSIKDFETLGFGDIFTFLSGHIFLLPTTWKNFFIITEKTEKPMVKVCMSQRYLLKYLSEAANGLGDNETLSKLMVSELLRMQFPSAGLVLVEDDFTVDILTTMSKNDDNLNSNVVLFSSTLSDFRAKTGFMDTDVGTNDAIELLTRAPMLIDLISWSYWDYKFAPSLGPLVGWLLSDVTTKELLCLVTKDGKVLRVDHSATADSFLESFLKRSSFETAVNFLSLICLYGGERKVPFSLLKCHAKNGFDVMLQISSNNAFESVPIASRFVVDCLGYLPREFRSFAAELLVSAFCSVYKDAYTVILSECKSKEDHMMIHELGLSLGIVEWLDEYCSCLAKSNESVNKRTISSENDVIRPLEVSKPSNDCKRDGADEDCERGGVEEDCIRPMLDTERVNNINAADIIESIRIEEFGLDPNLSSTESSILKKQHARLGRALLCLSQELYSQDSHFLLELVQNADDNVYPRNVEPTLTFILQEDSIVVLNNEHGFSAENIRALCDVGNSTKKASSAGYIGKKGIGFKSVFRVTNAPEIHSNGFHIKFDLTLGQIGFVLPTIVPPCDINLFSNLVSLNTKDEVSTHHYNTCIVLPLKSNLTQTSTVDNIISMFSDLHPSLLLFLHRLRCIKFRNMITDSFVIMRKQIGGNGLTNVSIGNETLTWFVESRKLEVNGIRDDIKTTEISVAFALEVSENGSYVPKLDQQYVFAFLPLRKYGLKFIIQGDFILPSSREEVDGDNPWNQWLLSEFPSLFVSCERSFCNLPGFNSCRGKGISVFLSYVPLIGEVLGFFSSLPRMIISKLCTSNCLLLEGEIEKWVPPCRVLRNWDEKARTLLPENLIEKHIGLGYLSKEIVLSDSLARALGIENYGPKILVKVLSSLCHTEEGLTSMGLNWLSFCLQELYVMYLHNPVDFSVGSDIMNTLRITPFIPLLDGCYGSIDEGMIWMNLDGSWNNLEASTRLFANLRIVNPAVFDGSVTESLSQMLSIVGVQRLSAHQVVKSHVLPSICDKKNIVDNDLMGEYLSFIMVHLQSSCSDCFTEREYIISEIYNKAFILTNHGFVLPSEVAIHFNNDFGNRIDISRLIRGIDVKWYEVDKTYLKYPAGKLVHNWRNFLKEIGITDFVQTVRIEKTGPVSSQTVLTNMSWEKVIIPPGSTVGDWESRELVDLLTKMSLSGDCEKSKYLLEVFDEIWDDYFNDKVVAYCNMNGESKDFRSSLVSALNNFQWVVSSLDNKLYYPRDLFHHCDAVCSIFGDNAPYAVPKVQSEKLVTNIGFKVNVILHDALSVLEIWKKSFISFRASITQMSSFYSFVWKELDSSNDNNMAKLQNGACIFVPSSSVSSSEVVTGVLLSPQEVYWHDNIIHQKGEFNKMLSNIYPSLHGFFVNACGVKENPPLLDYLAFLHHLSTVETPLKAAKKVFDVFVMWSNELKSGALSSEDVKLLKRKLEEKEMKVLPTTQDKWVSLHPSCGLVCWCDDEKLADEFKKKNNIYIFHLYELTEEEKELFQMKVSVLMKMLGILALSEVVTRELIYYEKVDNRLETLLVNRVLPYAQRYVSNVYHERYLQLKLSGFEKLNRLQIVVFKKLRYKNVIKQSKLVSKKKHDICCLLQDDILYATHGSDSHSIFIELSHFLINGNPDLHLANFLHMIAMMIKSGSSTEQIENFVLNSQKVPKLPDEEPVWSIQLIQPMTLNAEKSLTKCTAKHSSSSQTTQNGPPTSWKTGQKMKYVSKQIGLDAFSIQEHVGLTHQFKSLEQSRCSINEVQVKPFFDHKVHPSSSQNDPKMQYIPKKVSINEVQVKPFFDHKVPPSSSQIGPKMQYIPKKTGGVTFSTKHVPLTHQMEHSRSSINEFNVKLGLVHQDGSMSFSQVDQLSRGSVNAEQAFLTGRRGEEVAFNYYKNVGFKFVKWVNEASETGLPYDIEVYDENNCKEYIEVKTTESAKKDWFEISVREWQFAVERGESFSIARVVLSSDKTALVTILKNPARLCQLGHLKLAILMPK